MLAFDARDGLEIDRSLADGDPIEATEFVLRAVHTPGPRVEPPLLPAGAGADALLRRPHHEGLHRRHPPARRRHGRLPRAARAAEGLAPAPQVDRPGPRPPHRAARRQDRRVPRPPPRCARPRSSTASRPAPRRSKKIVAAALPRPDRGAHPDGRGHGVGPPPASSKDAEARCRAGPRAALVSRPRASASSPRRRAPRPRLRACGRCSRPSRPAGWPR